VAVNNVHLLHPGSSKVEPLSIRLTVAAYTMLLLVQLSGALLIALRKVSTPKVVLDGHREKWDMRAVFWVVVESGCIYPMTTFFGLVFFFPAQNISTFFLTLLGQISVRSSSHHARLLLADRDP
jgi:hypothetical protein